jgi:hypothetical protein
LCTYAFYHYRQNQLNDKIGLYNYQYDDTYYQSKDARPFNMTNDDWAANYWNKWISKNADEATPKAGGCLLVNDDNKSEPMIMLMETTVSSPPTQDCKISSTQGILVPLWIGWCDTR